MHSYVLANQFSLFKILSNLFLDKLLQPQCPKILSLLGIFKRPKILSLLGIFTLEVCVNTKNKASLLSHHYFSNEIFSF